MKFSTRVPLAFLLLLLLTITNAYPLELEPYYYYPDGLYGDYYNNYYYYNQYYYPQDYHHCDHAGYHYHDQLNGPYYDYYYYHNHYYPQDHIHYDHQHLYDHHHHHDHYNHHHHHDHSVYRRSDEVSLEKLGTNVTAVANYFNANGPKALQALLDRNASYYDLIGRIRPEDRLAVAYAIVDVDAFMAQLEVSSLARIFAQLDPASVAELDWRMPMSLAKVKSVFPHFGHHFAPVPIRGHQHHGNEHIFDYPAHFDSFGNLADLGRGEWKIEDDFGPNQFNFEGSPFASQWYNQQLRNEREQFNFDNVLQNYGPYSYYDSNNYQQFYYPYYYQYPQYYDEYMRGFYGQAHEFEPEFNHFHQHYDKHFHNHDHIQKDFDHYHDYHHDFYFPPNEYQYNYQQPYHYDLDYPYDQPPKQHHDDWDSYHHRDDHHHHDWDHHYDPYDPHYQDHHHEHHPQHHPQQLPKVTLAEMDLDANEIGQDLMDIGAPAFEKILEENNYEYINLISRLHPADLKALSNSIIDVDTYLSILKPETIQRIFSQLDGEMTEKLKDTLPKTVEKLRDFYFPPNEYQYNYQQPYHYDLDYPYDLPPQQHHDDDDWDYYHHHDDHHHHDWDHHYDPYGHH